MGLSRRLYDLGRGGGLELGVFGGFWGVLGVGQGFLVDCFKVSGLKGFRGSGS